MPILCFDIAQQIIYLSFYDRIYNHLARSVFFFSLVDLAYCILCTLYSAGVITCLTT